MASLIVEIGNTALKAALAEGTTLGKTFRFQGEKKIKYILDIVSREVPTSVVVASSSDIAPEDEARLRTVCQNLVIMDPSHKGMLSAYGLPDYLTYDRAAAIVATRHLFGGKECMIFDFGTTMTIDFIDASGTYRGGNVSPGFMTRFKSLARYSHNIPIVTIPEETAVRGTSMTTSVESGVVSGIMFEIQGYIGQNPGNILVFTGGDANYFAKRMKNSIFVVCNLVLMGLALITEDNVKDNAQ